MRFGMNLLLWTDTLSENMLPVLDELKEIGFDTVEIPCFDLDDLDNYKKWGKRFDELGLSRTGTAIRGAADNPASLDAAVRRQGVEKLLLVCVLLLLLPLLLRCDKGFNFIKGCVNSERGFTTRGRRA